LLIYALLITGFNLSKALRKVAIPRNTFSHWAESDPEFVDLLVEVEQIKKDFFEDGLIKLVKAGDSPSTIFANKTLNRDRGYGEVIESRISGTLAVASIAISELSLSPAILRGILDAVKERDNSTKVLPSLSIGSGRDGVTVPAKRIVSKVT